MTSTIEFAEFNAEEIKITISISENAFAQKDSTLSKECAQNVWEMKLMMNILKLAPASHARESTNTTQK